MAKPEVERQKSILNVLQGMHGIEPLKKLFWTELNYDRTNSLLPRKGWGDLASTALAEDPVLFATGGNDFQIIYARLNSDKLLMGMERPVYRACCKITLTRFSSSPTRSGIAGISSTSSMTTTCSDAGSSGESL